MQHIKFTKIFIYVHIPYGEFLIMVYPFPYNTITATRNWFGFFALSYNTLTAMRYNSSGNEPHSKLLCL
jgi:hypothetical protein